MSQCDSRMGSNLQAHPDSITDNMQRLMLRVYSTARTPLPNASHCVQL